MPKIVMVSYLNTIPFLKGLNSNIVNHEFVVEQRIPSECAEVFINGDANIALLPVAALPALPDHSIVSDFCIGCIGAVRTVVIFSKKPIEELDTIYLDGDSRSSALLTKILFKEYYQQNVEFKNESIHPSVLPADSGILMIGDKVFDYEDRFEYKLDLGHEWMKYTGLPFTFAVWVADDSVSKDTLESLNTLLNYGVTNILNNTYESHDNIDLDEYFTKYISYDFDDEKKQALKLFIEKGKQFID